jgi:hypothetical protein
MIKKTQTQRLLNRLFNAIASTVEDIGYSNTISLLNNGRTLHKADTEKLNICATAVITVFDMSMGELLSGTHKKYPRKYAFGIWVYLCNVELGYSLSDLSLFIGKDKSGLSRAKKYINNLNTENKFEQLIQSKFDACKEKLQQILNTPA